MGFVDQEELEGMGVASLIATREMDSATGLKLS